MIKRISQFCTRFPWLVLLIVIGISAIMAKQIREKSYFEADLVKFLPTDMKAVKSDDYSRKNFGDWSRVLIGVEKKRGSVMEVPVLRSIEKIVVELKGLKQKKTFNSLLKGETVTLDQYVGVDPDGVNSVANLEDAILDRETGSVISGSVIKKLKGDLGITSPEGKEENLPESDEELKKIIPGIISRIMGDRSYKNTLLSEDQHAATIRVSMIKKYEYKTRYTFRELSTAMDPERLKARFSGEETTFPFTIYQKRLNGVTIDDTYIEKHSSRVRKAVYSWLKNELESTFEDEPELKAMFEREMTPGQFGRVMTYISRDDFFMNSKIGTWINFTNNFWAFCLDQIDPFSRENLEFQLHNVKDIIDMVEIYHLVLDLLNEHRLDGVNYHVAGGAVVIGVFSQMMSDDMANMVPIAITVIVITLLLSFKSIRGVVIPLTTVLFAVIWTLGCMAIFGIPFTISTSGLPIILLAVGTAYGIHILNRYYEDVIDSDNKVEVVQKSVGKVGMAVVMAAITTMAGFSSLSTSSLTTLKHFGVFSTLGVLFALILSLTLTPSMLVLWKLPKRNNTREVVRPEDQRGIIINFMRSVTQKVIQYPKSTLVLFGLIFLMAGLAMTQNYFEGSMLSNFKEDNVVFQSDRFINENLTGTTDVNLIMTFRDKINLENPKTRSDFRERIDAFSLSWDQLLASDPRLQTPILAKLPISLRKNASQLPDRFDIVQNQIQLIRDMLNEEYTVERETMDQSGASISNTDPESGSLEDLEGAGEVNQEESDELGGLEDESPESADGEMLPSALSDLSQEQIAGLKELNQRLGQEETKWKTTAEVIVALRESKGSEKGIQVQYAINLVTDFLAVDIKQPAVLKKLEELTAYLKEMESPEIIIKGEKIKPTGFVLTPVDFVRKFYKVFYHDDNPAFDRLPNVKTDGFSDKTLTDRSIIGVALNQALSANRDTFESVIKPDLKEFQMRAMVRDSSDRVVSRWLKQAIGKVHKLFPEDNPYIESLRIGGGAPTALEITSLIGTSQTNSIMLSFLFVLLVTFFIFKSLVGGIYSLIPLLFTVILNFGMIALLGGEITMGNMIVSSIAIGTGVDYTIHFLERLKLQLKEGDTLSEAYTTTVLTSGRAIVLNAAAVAFGFLVFLISGFKSSMYMGILMAGTMLYSTIGALIILPAIVLVTRPRFLTEIGNNQRRRG